MTDRTEPIGGKASSLAIFLTGILFIFCIIATYFWLLRSKPINATLAVLMGIFYLIMIASVIVTVTKDAGHDLNIYARRNYDRKHRRDLMDGQ